MPSDGRMYSSIHTDDEDDSDSEMASVSSSSGFTPPASIASSQTSYEPSLRSASPVSVMSISSSLAAQIYRQEYGRTLNTYSEVYRLPADQEELDRLDKQHLMFVEVMGCKYPDPLAEVMADDTPGETKACLDIGCGNGNWIKDVARDFPHCQAVGVDLIPMQASTLPPNLRSEVDDVNLGLEHFYGDFNVVHTRLISSGIRDYARLIQQLSRVLRPGGLIDVSEFDFHTYDVNHQRINLSTHELGPPWWARWLTFLNSAARNLGGDVDAATHLFDWVNDHPDFEDVVYREFFLPVIPWAGDNEFTKRISHTVADDIVAFLRSGRPLLLGSGLAESFVDGLEQQVLREMVEGRIPQYTRLQCVYARKKNSA